MSTTKTAEGSKGSTKFDVSEDKTVGFGAIMIRVGRDTEIDDTREQLEEVHRRAVEHGLIDLEVEE